MYVLGILAEILLLFAQLQAVSGIDLFLVSFSDSAGDQIERWIFGEIRRFC